LIILSMLMLNLGDVMPLYCIALLIPVLGSISGVLGDTRSIKDTSSLLVSNIFNNTSFMVLGAFAINGIFTKCGLEKRFMAFLLRNFLLEGSLFLLVLLLGGTMLCSILYSGSIVLLVALAPVLQDGVKSGVLAPEAAKRILLSVAIAPNAGSTLLPISSPVTLITVSLLGDFDYAISTHTWVAIAAPVIFLTVFVAWIALLIRYRIPGPEKTTEQAWEEQMAMVPTGHIELTDYHIIFLGIGVVAVVCITIYASSLEPIIGNPACISLGVVVVVFGSGFMSREEFCQLEWDILALVGGTNVMAFLVRETGLGVQLSKSLVSSGLVELLPFQAMVFVMVVGAMSIAALVSHSITGVLLMPIVVAVGIKMQAAETMAMLVAVAIPLGMGFPSSSFDNVLSQATSETLGRPKAKLQREDWRAIGWVIGIAATALLVILGYQIALCFYKLPPPVIVIEAMTPEALKPKSVKENLPSLVQVASSTVSAAATAWVPPPWGAARATTKGRRASLRTSALEPDPSPPAGGAA